MSPQSTTFSLLAIASLLSSSIALPLDVPQIVPRQTFSIVNVDGSSSPTSTSLPSTTQTIIDTVTAPASTFIATVNVDRGSATETVYITITPTSKSTPSATALPPASMPYYPFHLNSTSNSTSTTFSTLVTPTIPLSTATSTEPCEETPSPVDDGAPWRHPYNLVPTGTGAAAYPTSYPTGSYDLPAFAKPSGMTAPPLPVLPPAAPYWFNVTEIPNVRRRIIVS
jgi:hypothetical protein